MEWPPHPSPTKGPKQGFGGAPRPHDGPPCSPSRRLAFSPWLFSATLAPFV